MVALRNLIIIFAAVVLLVHPPLVFATVATGAVTGREVWELTASGASKVAAAELTIANATRVLGLLGRYAGYVGLAFALYDMAANTWDWWHQDYDAGTVAPVAPGEGSAGVVPVGTGTGSANGPWLCADGFSGAAGEIPLGVIVTGITAHSSSASFGGAHGMCSWYDINWISTSSLPAASLSAASSGPTNRLPFIEQLDGAIADLTNTANGVISGVTVPMGQSFDGTVALLRDARNLVSTGLSLTPSDYTLGGNSAAGSASLPGNGIPASVPGGVETTVAPTQTPPIVDNSGVVSAVSSAAGVISSAIAASQSAVVSAVQATTAAIAASQAAVVSAVQAVAAPIVAAVAASQSAVVSAVQATTASISATQAAVVSAVQAIPAAISAALHPDLSAIKESVDAVVAGQTSNPPDATLPINADAVVCPVCSREDQWGTAWSSLRDAGMAAPVFGLINRIVLNPVGTIERVRTVSTNNFGVLSFDLNVWGIDTYIGVVRYVVIFVALMAGYFVIFG